MYRQIVFNSTSLKMKSYNSIEITNGFALKLNSTPENDSVYDTIIVEYRNHSESQSDISNIESFYTRIVS